MAKSNAESQRDKRAKEKAHLERIGAEKRSLIVSKAWASKELSLMPSADVGAGGRAEALFAGNASVMTTSPLDGAV